MHEPIVLLFDLGGVLVESSGQEALGRLLPDVDAAEILARWQSSESVGLFERGSISPTDFSEQFVAEWQLPLEAGEFLTIFSSWVHGFYPGAESLLKRLRERNVVACLSNTNAAHWAQLTDVRSAFDVCLASHLCGRMKPERAAYEKALQTLAVSPGQVLFFDDLLPNVTAARAIGVHAFHVRGFPETESTLRGLGFPVGCP